MALLDRLLPPWRQSDPEARAAAVRRLEADAQDILASVAQRDADARVRRIAVKKLEDAELLLAIGRSDASDEVRTLANGRAEELLLQRALSDAQADECLRALASVARQSSRVAIATRAADESVRRAALASVSEEAALAEIARRSHDPTIALEALQRLTDPTLVARVTAADVPEAALAALERILDPDTLNAIAQDAQAAKAVRKRARAILAATLPEDHPLRVAERRDQQVRLCTAIEHLNLDPDPTPAIASLRDAERRWQDLCGSLPVDADLDGRFQRARGAVLDAVARFEQRQRLGAAQQEMRSTRKHLCETVESLEGPATAEGLAQAQAAWRALPANNDVETQELAARFMAAVERCERRFERAQRRAAFHAQVEALVDEAEQLYQSNHPDITARRSALELRWAQLEGSAEGKKWMGDERALRHRFVEAGYALRDQQQRTRLDHERHERDARTQFAALCAHLEQLAESEETTPAEAQRALAAANEAMNNRDTLLPSLRPLRPRLAAAQQALERRIENQATQEEWKRWANADVQQRLIERAEELLQKGDARQMAKEIGRLDAEWKRFPVAPRAQSQVLWQRFRAAREELRKRVDAYLADNLSKKEALCAEAERRADSTDWKATAEAIVRMQAEWKQIGPVRQKLSAPLFDRFRKAANLFFERRKADLAARKQRHAEMLERMRALCESAEGLAESSDWETTASEIKRLQNAARDVWRPRRARPPVRAAADGTAATPRSAPTERQTDALEQRFRTACDNFFERYRRRDAIESERRVVQAESVLAQLETLHVAIASGEAPPAQEVRSRIEAGFAEWRSLGTFAPDQGKELNERLQKLCTTIESSYPGGLDEGDADAANLRQREKLCVRVERLASLLETPAEAPSTIDLGERLRQAMAANTIGGRATPASVNERREALEELGRLESKWHRLGPIVGSRARALALRFSDALARAQAAKRPRGA